MSIAALICATVMMGYLLNFVAEYRIHQNNFGYLSSYGATEYQSDVVDWYYRFHLIVVAIAAFEFFQNGSAQSVNLTSGLLLVSSGFALRLFAIVSRGKLWTRTIVLFDREVIFPVSRLYKAIKRPDYLGRLLEVIGIAIFLNANLALVASVTLLPLLWFLAVRQEHRANLEISIKNS